MEMSELRSVKAEVGGRILTGELVSLNHKTALIRFPGSGGREPFTVKRHLEKHRVKILGRKADIGTF